LPQAAAHSQVEKPKDKTIDLTIGGGLYLDGQSISKDEFESRAKSLPPDTTFLIRADRTIQFQQSIELTDVLKQLNFTKVAV
jgi:biopolymer transport protein ExbD